MLPRLVRPVYYAERVDWRPENEITTLRYGTLQVPGASSSYSSAGQSSLSNPTYLFRVFVSYTAVLDVSDAHSRGMIRYEEVEDKTSYSSNGHLLGEINDTKTRKDSNRYHDTHNMNTHNAANMTRTSSYQGTEVDEGCAKGVHCCLASDRATKHLSSYQVLRILRMYVLRISLCSPSCRSTLADICASAGTLDEQPMVA